MPPPLATPLRTNIFANNLDMNHRITYIMYINFQQNWVSRYQSKPCAQIYLQKFATIPIILFFKSIISDIHYHKTYMYVNFQQNRVNRSVKTVHTNLFANIANCIYLQLAIKISKNHVFRTCTTP